MFFNKERSVDQVGWLQKTAYAAKIAAACVKKVHNSTTINGYVT
jgi:hypothetical protein